MTSDHLSVGDGDPELAARLSAGLDEVNFPATHATAADRGRLSVKVVDEAGELVGGLAAWTWGGLLGVEMLWVRAPAVPRTFTCSRSWPSLSRWQAHGTTTTPDGAIRCWTPDWPEPAAC
ncbi:hypothetical protein [Streptacidiphilus neutrinimicus]|uniref:hypothetical protein n=1 Tax=Streptacidiphilus neutrinimicus TaxID=105420 RepID=UPI00126A235E|nr:hypothetical protein [Streptacidiphilus neutrinimicus]